MRWPPVSDCAASSSKGFALSRVRFAELGGAVADAFDLELDALLSPAGATAQLVSEMERLGPFGAGNAEPVVAVPDARVAFADIVGKDHVRLRLGAATGRG